MKEKVLIIGGAGFVGNYLIEKLKNEAELYVTKLKNEIIDIENINILDLDLLNISEVEKALREIKPEYIYNLAAQSSVALSWKNPQLTVDINIKGIINLLESIKGIENYFPRILLIGSSEEYGDFSNGKIDENEKTIPKNIYAATKVFQSMISKIYVEAYKMNIIYVRPFNHIGPKQSPMFVVSDFCKQVAKIEKEKQDPIIYVGNLQAKRDFSDVRDIVNIYVEIIKKGKIGEIYNVGSGKAISVEEILNIILKNSSKNISVELDLKKIRPIDVPIVEADTTKLRNAIDYTYLYSIEETIKDILNYWREKTC